LYIILYIQIAHEVKAQGHKKMRMLYDKTKWARVTILVYIINEGLSDMLLHISAGQQVAAERIIASICNSLIEGFSDIFLARVTILTNYNCEQTVPDRNRVPGPQEKNLDLTLRLMRPSCLDALERTKEDIILEKTHEKAIFFLKRAILDFFKEITLIKSLFPKPNV
ncbi:hypothetical protein ACJX0J_011444, partial [Zea mays]